MVYITVWHWMNKDYPAPYIHGAYWGMIGGDSDTAKIVRCDRYKSVRYEEHPIDENETVMFDSGHPVKITNSNGTSCNIYVGAPIIEPTLQIDQIISELFPAGDLPQYNRYGVYLEIHVSGTGKGTIRIGWGNDHTETKTGIVAGNYAYVYNLPSGTHNICAELFNIE